MGEGFSGVNSQPQRWERGTFSVSTTANPRERSAMPSQPSPKRKLKPYVPALLELHLATALLLPSAVCPTCLSAFALGCCSASPPRLEPSGRTGTGHWNPGAIKKACEEDFITMKQGNKRMPLLLHSVPPSNRPVLLVLQHPLPWPGLMSHQNQQPM